MYTIFPQSHDCGLIEASRFGRNLAYLRAFRSLTTAA